MIIGAQFYTLREQCKDLDGFATSLAKVAEIGYKTVQISGTCAFEPEWLKEQLDKNGLSCVITHNKFERLRDDTAQVIADHTVFGCDYIGIGSGINCLKTAEDMAQTVALAKIAGQVMHEEGKLLMYHNHAFEFAHITDDEDGKTVTKLEYLRRHTLPVEMGFTMDTYWVQAGGACVVDMIRRFAGRIPCIHLKDMAICDNEQHMAPIGRGNLNWDAILPAAADAGAKYALVEQDNTYGEDPFDCLKESYDFLTAMGLK